MYSSRFTGVLCLLLGLCVTARADFMVGGGVEGDSADGLSLSGIGGVALAAETWVSAAMARNSAELGSGQTIDNLYLDLELDHFLDPVGFQVGAAYWGDSDVLDSTDWRASVYWRGGRSRISADYENRSFDLTTPGTDVRPGRKRSFGADGLGASLKFDLGNIADLRLAGMAYSYSVPFRPIEDADVIDLVSISRLSIINSLVDHRASITLGIDQGERRWELEAATSEGAIARVRRNSYTVRYLIPVTERADVEFGLGRDESEIFSGATYASVYFYFYGLD